jgi:hypothetical protein
MMKEIFEFRIDLKYAHLLFKPDEGRNLGDSVKVVQITRDDPRFAKIPEIREELRQKSNNGFFYGWRIKRQYTQKEIEDAILFHIKIKITFEPSAEECGTLYDESSACKICGSNRQQVGALRLQKRSIPKKDIARTIAGEVVVSEKFALAIKHRGLKGVSLEPVLFDKGKSTHYQLRANSPELELTQNTVAGVGPFDFSESSEGGEFTVSGGYQVKFEKEIYKCPKGHTIGLNLLSEPYVLNTPSINNYDFFVTRQKIGVKRGLLRPEPLYLCSSAFRKMIEEEKLTGFVFEIAHIQDFEGEKLN